MPFKANAPFNLTINPTSVNISLIANGISKHIDKPIQTARDYIIANYNWNGIIKLMRFVYQKHDEIYQVPDQLNGTIEDEVQIIPDKGIAFVMSLQMQSAVKQLQVKSKNAKAIFKQADGKPGPGFYKNIIKKDRLDFLNESFNKTLKDPDTGEKLLPPTHDASPSTYYHYLKKLVQLRNGLWSNRPGVVNLVGLRRVIVEKRSRDAGYNDTIASCWVDHSGNAHCELNIATTEPGSRQKARQLFPQTMTMLPGYHNMRQPAGRTRNALKEGSSKSINKKKDLKRNDRIPEWCSGDTTMNFHQGGNSFLYPSAPGLTKDNARKARNTWLAKFGLNQKMQHGTPSSKADTDTLFKLNLVLSEIYLILSKYGETGGAPYKNLENMLGHKPITRSGIQDGKIIVRQKGLVHKVIDVQNVKRKTVRIWIDGRRKESTKKKIYEILKHISDYSPAEIKTWKNLSIDQIVALIKDEHVERIVDIQIEYLTRIDKGVDGIAGNDFYKIITGILQKKSDAVKDKVQLDKLLDQFDALPLNNSIKKIFKRSLTIRTTLNRTNVRDNTKHIAAKDLDIVDKVIVGSYSAGCQVFFDTEVFYNFWTKLLKRGEASGQRHWYYTLVDATNFKKSGVI